MLAQNFKSADELGIPENIWLGLQKVLVLLETEQVHHVQLSNKYDAWKASAKPWHGGFNMRHWVATSSCGTAYCIGGMLDEIMGAPRYHGDHYPALKPLFYPIVDIALDAITVDQAARAVRNFLTTGYPCWYEVTRGSDAC